ncbi:MAG: cell division ATP-binding protein FtsE [Oscillospiraceae bacterium]|nr:cell division ATP-binding protein FtsE [Oscillospiraceae bacterium]
MIRLDKVTKFYPENDTPALDELSLHIRKGEFVFVLGSSGAGKSTFIKLLLREVTADSGSVRVNGFNLKKIRQRKVPHLRRSMGVVFQDFRLIPTMTAYENVAFAMRVTNVPERDIRDRVPFVLNLVGLGDKLDRYPDQLSGGEQQRVALARALVHSPQLIIADEPTGNIDPSLSIEIMELLSAINSVGVTVVVVTHEHELVNRFNKRVIRIEQGRVVEDTDPPPENEWEESEPADSSEEALNRLADEQRRQTGAAWGTDANLHVSLEHLRSEPVVSAAQEEPAEEPEEPWEDAGEESPFVGAVRRSSPAPHSRFAPPADTDDEPAEAMPVVQPAVEQTAEEPVYAEEAPAKLVAPQPAEEQSTRSTTMDDVDELLRQLLNG